MTELSDGANVVSTTRKKHRKPRGRGLRTTTGCTICRQRHLKCGEEKPQCGNCARGGRQCTYGSTVSNTRQLSTIDLNLSENGNETSTADDVEFSTNGVRPRNESISLPGIITAPDDQCQDVATEQTPVYSPLSTLSSSASQGPEAGPLRWFSLVATDFQNNQQASGAFPSIFTQATANDTFAHQTSSWLSNIVHPANSLPTGLHFRTGSHSRQSPRNTQGDLPSWHADVVLKNDEVPLLQHFCKVIAIWLDILDPIKHFASALPQLAMSNEGLMKAMLALSARHIALRQTEADQPPLDQTVALQYYHDTLQYLHNAMKHPEYLKSIEVNATSLILSTYEMIDGMGRGWIRHLKGVFWIQRSQSTNPESGGLKAAIWWAWLRQDTWAALREKRKVLTIFTPTIQMRDMDFWHHANFVSFLFGLCVSYISEGEAQVEGSQLQERIDRARYLFSALDEWYSYLPINFKAIPFTPPGFNSGGPFEAVWINPPSFGTVLQVYYASRAILLAHAPAVGGIREFNSRRKELLEAIDTVCGIAMTIQDGGSSFVSTSCLWACGLCAQDDIRREAIANLITEHKNITGWPVSDLGEELRQEWRRWE